MIGDQVDISCVSSILHDRENAQSVQKSIFSPLRLYMDIFLLLSGLHLEEGSAFALVSRALPPPPSPGFHCKVQLKLQYVAHTCPSIIFSPILLLPFLNEALIVFLNKALIVFLLFPPTHSLYIKRQYPISSITYCGADPSDTRLAAAQYDMCVVTSATVRMHLHSLCL